MKGGHHFRALILFSYSIFNDMHQHFNGDTMQDRLKSKILDDLISEERLLREFSNS